MLQKRVSSWKPLYQLSGIAAQGVSIARQVAHLAHARPRAARGRLSLDTPTRLSSSCARYSESRGTFARPE